MTITQWRISIRKFCNLFLNWVSIKICKSSHQIFHYWYSIASVRGIPINCNHVLSVSLCFSFPTQTLSTQSNSLGGFLGNGVNVALSMTKLFYGERFQPFVSVTVNDLLFGYEDTLVSMANKFYPRSIRPDMSKMGLLLGVSTIQWHNHLHAYIAKSNCRISSFLHCCCYCERWISSIPICTACVVK